MHALRISFPFRRGMTFSTRKELYLTRLGRLAVIVNKRSFPSYCSIEVVVINGGKGSTLSRAEGAFHRISPMMTS